MCFFFCILSATFHLFLTPHAFFSFEQRGFFLTTTGRLYLSMYYRDDDDHDDDDDDDDDDGLESVKIEWSQK